MADDPGLNRRVAEFLIRQNKIAGRIVDAMLAKDLHAMNAATQELADLKAAHHSLDDDIAKYEANAGIEPAITEPTAEPAKPRRTRKPRALRPAHHEPRSREARRERRLAKKAIQDQEAARHPSRRAHALKAYGPAHTPG